MGDAAVSVSELQTYSNSELEPIALSQIKYKDLRLRFRTPLVLYPYKDESGELLFAEDGDYELLAYAEDREELKRVLNSLFTVMWNTYVAELGDGKLTPGAAKIRRNLLNNLVAEDTDSAVE